jgi:hypothetical protein
MIQGEVKMSTKSGADTSEAPSAGGQPTFQAHMEKEIIAKIPPASAHQVEKPKTRGDLINLLLSNPRTAPQLNQFASSLGMPAKELATKSSSGKTITGGPLNVPPSGAKISLNWEAGVRFTPRFNSGSLSIKGVFLTEKDKYEYGLSDLYQRDEVLLFGDYHAVRIYFEGHIPTGEYIIEVELETSSLGLNDRLKIVYLSGDPTYLLPWKDKKALATDGKITSFIGQLHVRKNYNNWLWFRISLPSDMVPDKWYEDSNFSGIFRGITITRM